MTGTAPENSSHQPVSSPLLKSYVVLTGLSVAAAMLILIGVLLPSETSRDQEKWADPLGIVLAGAFVIYAAALWLRKPRPRNAAMLLAALVVVTIVSDYLVITLT